jgi:phage N-6-adenine-methyltransferase
MNAELFELPAAESLEQDERYTTRDTMDWCAKQAGVDAFDLDVAACEESHKAETFFTVAMDGLTRPWFGRVWCNPPYSDIAPWVAKAWREMESLPGPDVIAMLIPASRTEQGWWQTDVEAWRDRHKSQLTTHFLPGRTRFGHPGNPEGVGVGSPPFGCVLLVWRRQ